MEWAFPGDNQLSARRQPKSAVPAAKLACTYAGSKQGEMSGKDDKLTHSLGENHAFERLMEYINSQGAYHPRTQDVSNQLSKEIVRDLYGVCTTFRRDVDRGLASFDLNIELRHEKRTHRVDLVIGTIEEEQYEQTILIPATSPEPLRITQTPPSEIRLVMEHKTVATAHRNVYNRSRIMAELATFLRGSYDEVVSAVSLMIGTSQTFLNYETFNRVKNALEALCEETRYSLEEMEGLLGTGDPKLHELLSIPASPPSESIRYICIVSSSKS